MKPARIWYVILNASRARILRDLPGPRDPAPEEVTMEGPRRNLREIMADRPTRSFTSSGDGRRSGVDLGSDPVEEDARSFLRDVLAYLQKQKQAQAFDQLVVVAPADTLGLWRAEVPGTLRNTISQEIVKNLMPLPSRDLVAAVRGLVSA